jgi:transcriptional regulator with XRE-family HTH domain
MEKQTVLDKLNKIAIEDESWKKKAEWRNLNEAWLMISAKIAIKTLSALRNKGISQKDLAEKMNVSPQYINKIVKGQENLSLETITKLEAALGIQLIEIIGFTNSVEYRLPKLVQEEICATSSINQEIPYDANQHTYKEPCSNDVIEAA